MEKFSLFVGIDISKKSFHVAVIQSGMLIFESSYPNTAYGLHSFYQQLLKWEPDPKRILLCLEHSGVYIERLCLAYQTSGICLWVVHPLTIKYAQVNLERLKNDQVDARKIAEFAHLFKDQAKTYQPLNAQQEQIKNLFRLRKQLVKLRQQCYNFGSTNADKAIPCVTTGAIFDQLISYLSQIIIEVEAALKEIVKSVPKLKRLFQILTSIPTIGPVTAWHLIFVTQAFSRFENHKKLACYIGTAPFERSSGSSLKSRAKVSKKGYRHLKTNLTMGAVRHIQPRMVFTQYYRYMTEQQNKEHLHVINSIRNMIIKLAFDLVKKDQLFDLDTFLKNKKSWHKFLILS